MTPKLNWQLDDDENWYANIFLDYSLNIIHNGEDFYNIELQDAHGNEIDEICGGETVELAKLNALGWLNEELRKVTND
jgi:hypothetical protein